MAKEIDNKKNTSRTILIILVLLLLLFNAFLLLKLVQKKGVEEELVETTALKVQLEKEVDSFRLTVNGLEGTILEKDSTLLAYQMEMEEKVKEIEQLIQKEKVTRYRYNQALEEIKKLEYYTKKYQSQIEELKKQNQLLTDENTNLKTEVKEIKKEVDNLTDENVELTNKVNLGAMLKTNSISAIGIQKRNSGKTKETDKGSKMEALKINFSIKDNILAKGGPRDFYVKVQNPKGETLYLEERGSGQFQYQGVQSLYTVKAEFDFNNNPDHIYTIIWDRGSIFEKGNYEIQIFNDGVMIGKNSFEVK